MFHDFELRWGKALSLGNIRRKLLSEPIYQWARGALPKISATEREAIEAGDVWWDAELFTGNPDWKKLLDTPPARLSPAEQAFLLGPVEELCGLLDEWKIQFEWRDLPANVWDFLKRRKFFGMIIPTEYGGLGFSAYAHSQVIRKISTRSVTAAVTVMVPNSLGPGELLVQFGTDEQKAYWLPRLADGREIPCFCLTSPEAGSDAASMRDSGVIGYGEHNGARVLGMRLNWRKRYITLGPVATVLALAFKAYDPDRLLGDEQDLGITIALAPANAAGVQIGRRHLPASQAFQNGPNEGRDVFAPLDWVIGGKEQIGAGWKMTMSALAAGRGISLPSLAGAATAFGGRSTGAYARIREQFGIPIGDLEGVQDRLGHLAATTYRIDAGRRLTCAALDHGYKPAVISAIMKADATERMREAVEEAMDLHGGKAVMDGPRNYLGNLHRATPIAVTVEGANLLTRCLIIFGQGAIRCHPYLLEEMRALADPDKGIEAFDRALWRHVGHFFANVGRAFVRNWSGGLIHPAPPPAGRMVRHYNQLSRHTASFALVADLALITLGGRLKRNEMISARLGDVLCELYFLSAVLKRFEDEGRNESDEPLVDYCVAAGLRRIETLFAETLANLPNRVAALIARAIIQPFGPRLIGPSDELARRCAAILMQPGEARDRLTADVFRGCSNDAVAQLELAFDLAVETAPLRRRLREANVDSIEDGLRRGVIGPSEAERLRAKDVAISNVIAVDDFDPRELSPLEGKDEAQWRRRHSASSARTV
ncbi:acyl-CoA dehydrogenase [Methylocystis sp. JAN1]|uniref:acyl-CoA dehydrogenase n=1 Tax=Methylocystis sp. JAN1 TaxID=3397211 RepID=UPI003FA2C000